VKAKTVTVFAPATISNLGSGFDVLGIAIDKPGDIVVAARRREPGLSFSVKSDKVEVPSDPAKNVSAHVASMMLDELKPPFGVEMVLHKLMPIGSGLGSSAASSVAAVVAVNELLSRPLKRRDLLRFAVEGERKASGTPHADNVAPSLLGGAQLIRSYLPLDVVSIPILKSPVWVVVHPHVIVRTEEARSILPYMVNLSAAVQQWGNVAGLTIGLATGDAALIGKCVEDVIAEPARIHLVPGFVKVKDAALKAGAVGCSLSGSGPSMFAVATSFKAARAIGRTMARTFSRIARVQSEVYISRINFKGARILSIRSR